MLADNSGRFLINYEETIQAGPGEEGVKKYKGEWMLVQGQMLKDGFGRLTWADGSVYEGMFQADQMSGTGQMKQANGDVYQGEWRNNMANGLGTFVDSQGSTYSGQWEDDLQHGAGVETWQQG